MKPQPINLSAKKNDGFTIKNIAEKANLKFLSLSKNVTLSFPHFVKLVQAHNLEKLLKNEEKKENPHEVAVPSGLLVDISSSEEMKKKKEGKNILSGVFLIGILLGCIGSIFGMVLLMTGGVPMTRFLLVNMGLGFIALLLLILGIPAFLASMETPLKKMQKKHQEFLERLVDLFQ